MENSFVAGIELGGTKTIATIARGTEIIDQFRIPSDNPAEVLMQTSQWLKSAQVKYRFERIGIASFGPICLDKSNANYGYITKTPKPNWEQTNVVGAYKSWFDGPIGFDTDVNGAALAEYLWGAATGTQVSVYITIGTGIGGGIIINGKPVHGFMHPEMGHMKIKRGKSLEFGGICPFHGDCIEGLASGPAIKARAGLPAERLEQSHAVWDEVSDEIAEFLVNIILVVSPQRISIGGGVFSENSWLFEKIRHLIGQKLNGYIANLDEKSVKALVGPPLLGAMAGPLGAIAVGIKA